MIVLDLRKRIADLDETTPVVFMDKDGGWANVDAKLIDGELCIMFSEPDKEGRI